MAGRKKLEDIWIDLRFSSKQLLRQVKQKEKEINTEKEKARVSFAKGNAEVARIHAENAVRKNKEITFCIKLASNIDSVASYVQTAITTRQTIADISSLVGNLNKAVQVLDAEKIASIMNKFGEQCEDLKQQTTIMDANMVNSSAATVPQEDVDQLLKDIATEHQIITSSHLDSVALTKPILTSEPQFKLTEQEEKNLEARLAKLRG